MATFQLTNGDWYQANGIGTLYWIGNSTATTTNGLNPWTNWVATSATTTTTTLVWDAWNTPTTGTVWQQWQITAPQWRQATPEELEQQRVLRAQAEERMAQERADREQAVQRAETLLHEQLRPGQRRMLRLRNHFYVRSQHGRRYEINRGHHGNVYEVDGKGKRVARLCVYATGGVPEGDCMLAQKLHIEYDEDHFRRVANITPMVAA